VDEDDRNAGTRFFHVKGNPIGCFDYHLALTWFIARRLHYNLPAVYCCKIPAYPTRK
jgi:hypothetical protein